MTGSNACPVRWCEQRPDHDGLHRRTVAALELTEPRAGRTLTVAIEAADTRPYPTLTVTAGHEEELYVALSWQESRHLAHLLADTARRFE